MPLFGAHMSISGGLERAVLSAAEFGFDCVQLFSKNSNQWKAKPITDEAAELFKKTLQEKNIVAPLIHDSYLINLGSAKPELFDKSLVAFTDELHRAQQLGVPCVVMHPGTPTGDESDNPEESGLRRVADGIDRSFDALLATLKKKEEKNQVVVLLETTAGQGSNLGWKFEHLARIIELSKHSDKLGVCVDTCHIHAAGYHIDTRKNYEKTFDEFDRVIGLQWLKAFHLNDSVKGTGSRVDRHAHIGHGTLGLDPFRFLVNDPRFKKMPMYLETPKGTTEINGKTLDWDTVNLQTLKKLIK